MHNEKNASSEHTIYHYITSYQAVFPAFGKTTFRIIKGNFFALFLSLQLFSATNSLAQHLPRKEFRGVWIATVNNIDWPSAPGLPVEVQKREFRELIERIDRLNLNAVIFQIRPASDAFYQSEIEPWSYFMTGKQGRATTPFFDPLAYAIELCHSKGMELHAWFNPFRVRNNGFYPLDPGSFAAKNPQYIHLFDHKLFLDPGIPKVRNHVVKVIMEVVRKYDVDAIHFDDYFYPYPVRGKNYPDQKTFSQFGKEYYPKRLGDWRRENINKFIVALHDSIKSVKPSVKLGISPFGVWRNKSDDPHGSPGVKGTTSYDHLYADVYKWLANDWIDYIIPQLYWEQGNRFGDFAALAKWWNDHSFGKPLYLGQALYKSTGSASDFFTNPAEISEQISILRRFENVGGFALYSASHLAKLSEVILSDLYTKLLPPNRDTMDKTEQLVLIREIPPFLPPNEQLPELLSKPDKGSVSIASKSVDSSSTDSEPPVPDQISVTKSREGWDLSWKTTPALPDGLRFSIIIVEPVKSGDTIRTVFKTTVSQQVFIPRDSAFKPSKVLFGIVSINNMGVQSSTPKLFKIRGKRIVFN